MNVTSEYTAIERYVQQLYESTDTSHLPYHNLQHTRNVVLAASEIAAHYKLSESESLALFLASWFHDTGYLFTEPALHEEKSVEIMKNYAADTQLPQDVIDMAAAAIMSTKSPRNPQTLIEKIICDADFFHLGTKDFDIENKKVYKELLNRNPNLDKDAFNEGTYNMMSNQVYYTDYAAEKLNKRKEKNMAKANKKIKKDKVSPTEEMPIDSQKESNTENAELKSMAEAKPSGITTKGIQTMLRLTSSNHIQLSEMADNKANILISVNAIIISIILSVLMRKLQTDPYLTIPSIIFLLTAVTTIVLAILATRPKVNTGTFTESDILSKKTNLLFFGNFHQMSLQDYDNAMKIMMADPDYLYSSIVQDIYYLGVVLGKKYKLIRIAYSVFMIGIILSVLAFAIASFTSAPPEGSTQIINNSGGSPF